MDPGGGNGLKPPVGSGFGTNRTRRRLCREQNRGNLGRCRGAGRTIDDCCYLPWRPRPCPRNDMFSRILFIDSSRIRASSRSLWFCINRLYSAFGTISSAWSKIVFLTSSPPNAQTGDQSPASTSIAFTSRIIPGNSRSIAFKKSASCFLSFFPSTTA